MLFRFRIAGKEKVIALLSLFLFAALAAQSIAFPVIPAEFYGTASINWTNATQGMNVTAYDSEDVLCGQFTVQNEGYYGLMSCMFDDEYAEFNESAQESRELFFFINNERAVMFGDNTWEPKSFKQLDLAAQNFPPYFEHNLTHQHVNETFTLLYDINCSDLNYWDTITYYVNTTLFNISLYTGLINWTPLRPDVGNHSVLVTCSDSRLNTSGILNITVHQYELPPILDPIGNLIAIEGEPFSFKVNATDPNFDNLTFMDNSTFFNIDPYTGWINFTPRLEDVGNHSINISVTDGIFTVYEVIIFTVVRGPYCGDGYCGIGENCLNCPEDCGPCPPLPPGIGEDIDDEELERLRPEIRETYLCHEKWECTPWSECMPDGYETRRCVDVNRCGTTRQRPPERRECDYIPPATCDDGIQNCHLMPDGTILCEEGIDCGGPCPPCPTCYDGIQNCHRMPDGSILCEEGIDCGGPCPPCVDPVPRLPELEMPMRILFFPWFFVILAGIIILACTCFDTVYMSKIRRKKIEAYRKAIIKYRPRRIKIYAAAIASATILLIIASYVYSMQYMDDLRIFYMWMPLIIISGTAAVTAARSRLRYDEKKAAAEEKRITERDAGEKKKLIRLQDDIIYRLELKAGKKAYSFLAGKKELGESRQALKSAYLQLREITSRRKKIKEKINLDELLSPVSLLLGSSALKKISKQEPKIKMLLESLRRLKECAKKSSDNEERMNAASYFISCLREISYEHHLMMRIRAKKSLVDAYNLMVEIYEPLKEIVSSKEDAIKDIPRIEDDLKKSLMGTVNSPGWMENVRKDPEIASLHNRIADVYDSYKKKDELVIELKKIKAMSRG